MNYRTKNKCTAKPEEEKNGARTACYHNRERRLIAKGMWDNETNRTRVLDLMAKKKSQE